MFCSHVLFGSRAFPSFFRIQQVKQTNKMHVEQSESISQTCCRCGMCMLHKHSCCSPCSYLTNIVDESYLFQVLRGLRRRRPNIILYGANTRKDRIFAASCCLVLAWCCGRTNKAKNSTKKKRNAKTKLGANETEKQNLKENRVASRSHQEPSVSAGIGALATAPQYPIRTHIYDNNSVGCL
jgi:hypothetical protein